MQVLNEFVELHPWWTIAALVIPWCWAVGVWIGLLIRAYWRNLWKGMDEEKRYEYVKVARW
jgi:hypothetical protein